MIKTEEIKIPTHSEEIELRGTIYSSENTPERAPFIINLHGLLESRNKKFPLFFSEGFARNGYYVLAYDFRAHGETKRATGKIWIKMLKDIFLDIRDVISWVLKNQKERLLEDKIALFGRSLGGAIILTQGYEDPRAKLLIPLCTRYDYSTFSIQFPADTIAFMSAKNYLHMEKNNNERIIIAHCKDDEQIPFENVMLIKNHLGLADENVIIFESGGHAFKGHRQDILTHSLEFLKKI